MYIDTKKYNSSCWAGLLKEQTRNLLRSKQETSQAKLVLSSIDTTLMERTALLVHIIHIVHTCIKDLCSKDLSLKLENAVNKNRSAPNSLAGVSTRIQRLN